MEMEKCHSKQVEHTLGKNAVGTRELYSKAISLSSKAD